MFIFLTATEPGAGVLADRITDFNNGNDTIVLSNFMAGGRFIAAAAFAATGVNEVRYTAATGVLQGDVSGNGTVDWEMVLTSKPALAAADFLF